MHDCRETGWELKGYRGRASKNKCAWICNFAPKSRARNQTKQNSNRQRKERKKTKTKPGHRIYTCTFDRWFCFIWNVLKAKVIMAIKLQDINYNKMMALACERECTRELNGMVKCRVCFKCKNRISSARIEFNKCFSFQPKWANRLTVHRAVIENSGYSNEFFYRKLRACECESAFKQCT